MIENYKSGLVWQLMRGCPYLVAGLRAAGFTGGWLSNEGHPRMRIRSQENVKDPGGSFTRSRRSEGRN